MNTEDLQHGLVLGQSSAAQIVRASQGILTAPRQIVLQPLKIGLDDLMLQLVLPIFQSSIHSRFPTTRATRTRASSFPFAHRERMTSAVCCDTSEYICSCANSPRIPSVARKIVSP